MHALILVAPTLLLHAATLNPSSVPATGKAEALLTLDAPMAVHLSAQSASGTSCTVIDRVRGPFASSGSAGTNNCELDLLLDAGQYKVRLESSRRGKGTVQLKATPFTEVNPTPVRLVPRAIVESALPLGAQASYWLSLSQRTNPRLRIAGRTAGDVRVWRDGEWLEPLNLRHEQPVLEPGRPIHEWQLDQLLEAGDYRVTVYGRDPAAGSSESTSTALSVQWGFLQTPPAGSASFTMPATGALRLELARAPLAAFVNVNQPSAAQLTVFDVDDDGPVPNGRSCAIAAKSVVLECSVLSQAKPGVARYATVRGAPGIKGRLEWLELPVVENGYVHADFSRGGFYGPPSTTLSFIAPRGPALLALRDVPLDTDGAPLGCVLEHYGPKDEFVRQVAVSAPRIASGQMLESEFNYDEQGVTVWFKLASSGRYRVQTSGGRKSNCEIYQDDGDGTLRRITETKNQASECNEVLSLSSGLYQVRLNGGLPGIEKLTIREDSAKAVQRLPTKATCTFPEVSLEGGRYRLHVNRTGTVLARGLTTAALPLNVQGPLHFTLDAKGSVNLPLAKGEAMQVLTSGGKDVACALGRTALRGSGGCSIPSTSEEETLVITNPGDEPVQVTMGRFGTTPEAPTGVPFTPTQHPIARIAPEKPTPFDFDQRQTQAVVFDVEASGLYSVTTQGLLETECRLRTPVVAEVAANRGGGRGRNCLISTYLQKGRYMMTASTVGRSKGRGSLYLTRRPSREQAPVVADGENFFRVDANDLVQQRLVVKSAGSHLLTTNVQGSVLSCRLDDADGWPVETVPSPCNGERTMAVGTYLWTQLPLTVESMRHTKLERVREPVVLKGNKAHAIEPFTWYSAELGADGKDEFTFSLEGDVSLELVLSNAMQGRIYRLEANKPPKPVEIIPPSGGPAEQAPQEFDESGDSDDDEGSWAPSNTPTNDIRGVNVTLPEGHYKLVTEHSRGDIGIAYRLHFGSATLLPGMTRTVPAPSTVPLFIPRDGTLRLRTTGEVDVRCRLFDENKHLVFEGGDNGADWNCALAEPISKGSYTLVIESETLTSGNTSVSLALAAAEDKGVLQDGMKLSLAAPVVTTMVPLAEKDAVQEFSVRTLSRATFSCALIDAKGAVVQRHSRVSECSMLVRPRLEHFTLRLWTTDGPSQVQVAYRSRPVSQASGTIAVGQAVKLPITKPGRYVTAQQVFCISDDATGPLRTCGPEASLESGAVIFTVFGLNATPLPLREVKVPASEAAATEQLSSLASLQTVTATAPSLFLSSATCAHGERVSPSCAIEGAGALHEGHDAQCFAVSRVGTEATTRFWAPGEQRISSQVVRRAVAIPERAEPLPSGRKQLTFNTVGLYTLPSTRSRLELTMPPDSWAVLLDDLGASRDLCAPTPDLSRCVLTGTGGRLLLTAPIGRAEVTTIALETPQQTVSFTGLYEDAPRAPGTVQLRVPVAAEDRVAHIDGAVRCTTALSTGARIVDCHASIPANVGADLLIEHTVDPIRAVVHVPGQEWSARLGVQLPIVPGPALPPAVAVPLQSGDIDRTLVVTQDSVVRVAAESGVCGLFRGNALLSVDGMDAGCELVRVLSPGPYRLLVRPFAGRPKPGTLRWTAEPVTALQEGVAVEEWIAPGEVRLFRFETKDKGKIGLGLQAKSELLNCAVFNDSYKALGEGCHQYLALDKGVYLLTVRNPPKPGAVPIAFKPVLFGLAGDKTEVPEEFLRDFFSRIGVQP